MASPNAAFRQRHNQAAMSTSSTASASSSTSRRSPSADAAGSAEPLLGPRSEARRDSGRAPGELRRSDTFGQLAAILSDEYIGESKPLLLAVPVAMALSLVPHMPAALVFLLNGAALVPLAALNILTVLTMTKNARVWGGLFRAVGGNSTEFIVSFKHARAGFLLSVWPSLPMSLIQPTI